MASQDLESRLDRAPKPLKIRCALCRRWLPGNDRLPTPVGLSHAACVMAFQAAKLTLTKETP